MYLLKPTFRLLVMFSLSVVALNAQTTISADFGPTPRPVVPANVLGVNISNDPTTGNSGTTCTASTGTDSFQPCLTNAGITRGRKFVELDTIFPAGGGAPNFSSLDADLEGLQKLGLTTLLVLVNTPADLQQTWSTCTGGTTPPTEKHSPPKSYSAWGQDAATVVTHVEGSSYAKAIAGYEIWNEPDASNNSLCSPDNTDAERLSEYLQIYENAAPLMQAALMQAAQTGVSIGGPVLADPSHLEEWLISGTTSPTYGLLTDPNLASGSVNFVSYHNYLSGTDFNSSVSREDAMASLVMATTNQMPKYVTNAYAYINDAGLSLPVYVTEVNDSAATDTTDCCRNVGNVSGVAGSSLAGSWNVLSVIQQFTGAYTLPTQVPLLFYFRADPGVTTGFCLFGDITNDDCAAPTNGTYTPYPQLFAFDLLESAHLQDGVNLTKGAPTSPSGLPALSYMTPGSTPYWVIVVANPTSTTYSSSQPWAFQNVSPGNTTDATAYSLTCNGNACDVDSNSTVPMSVSKGVATMTFGIPAYSAVAMVIH